MKILPTLSDSKIEEYNSIKEIKKNISKRIHFHHCKFNLLSDSMTIM